MNQSRFLNLIKLTLLLALVYLIFAKMPVEESPRSLGGSFTRIIGAFMFIVLFLALRIRIHLALLFLLLMGVIACATYVKLFL